jgi:hypothetical protein
MQASRCVISTQQVLAINTGWPEVVRSELPGYMRLGSLSATFRDVEAMISAGPVVLFIPRSFFTAKWPDIRRSCARSFKIGFERLHACNGYGTASPGRHGGV